MITIPLTDNGRVVLERRYLRKDDQGRPAETPEEMLRRVAKAVAKSEAAYGGDPKAVAERFYEAMARLEFLPNSPTLMNAGPASWASSPPASSCPWRTRMEAIFEALKHTALIHKSGGGTGFSFSRLRPQGRHGRADAGAWPPGPVSFMKVFDAATEAIKQGGTRRGANMGILRVRPPRHPGVHHAPSRGRGTLDNFNISVAVTDAFMEAVPRTTDYDLINPRDGEVRGSVSRRARSSTSSSSRPGRPATRASSSSTASTRTTPPRSSAQIEATNPCGEQPLLPYESCNLGSINLAQAWSQRQAAIDWEQLGRDRAAGASASSTTSSTSTATPCPRSSR